MHIVYYECMCEAPIAHTCVNVHACVCTRCSRMLRRSNASMVTSGMSGRERQAASEYTWRRYDNTQATSDAAWMHGHSRRLWAREGRSTLSPSPWSSLPCRASVQTRCQDDHCIHTTYTHVTAVHWDPTCARGSYMCQGGSGKLLRGGGIRGSRLRSRVLWSPPAYRT